MTAAASLFVVVFTLVNIVACLALLWWTARAPAKQDDATAKDVVPTTGHVWDDDLEELNNPLPRWWLGLFIVTVVFGLAYLVFYPGLGNFAGTRNWSQVAQHDAQVGAQRARLEQHLATLQNKSLRELAHDASAMSTARNLFGQNCSTCHGSDGRGAKGFPNLADSDWLWGHDENSVYETIAHGRHGMMPPWGEALGEQGVEEVASYVFSLGNRKAPDDWIAAGKQHFAATCAGCHGVEGKGNPMMGAPNLTDEVWLYGGDFDSIKASIVQGRNNQMPAHLDLLGEARVRLLAAYVLSLSEVQGESEQWKVTPASTSPDGTTADEATAAAQANEGAAPDRA